MWINKKSYNFSDENIEKIEALKQAVYVCDTQLEQSNGFTNIPISIFYGNEVHPVSNSKYFGLYYNENNKLVITNGSSADNQKINAVVSDNGEVIFSRFRHDFRTSEDSSISIDGGRDYVKISGNNNNLIELVIKDGKLEFSY